MVKRKQLDPTMAEVLASANGLLSAPRNDATLDDMVLDPLTRDQLDRVVLEYARRGALLARGLHPARKLLFTGPPGVGKTLGAGAIAQALGMPLFRVEMHGVVSHYLGETAGRLAKVFEYVRSVPAVYLFDEFDSLGADRASVGGDAAGEMRRVVNSLLMFIEDDDSNSLIIAATNFMQLLDEAMFRRFDDTIAFPLPTLREVTELVNRHLRDFDVTQLDYAAIHAANPRLGHADLCAVLDRVRKDYVLASIPITTVRLVATMLRRVCAPRAEPLEMEAAKP